MEKTLIEFYSLDNNIISKLDNFIKHCLNVDNKELRNLYKLDSIIRKIENSTDYTEFLLNSYIEDINHFTATNSADSEKIKKHFKKAFKLSKSNNLQKIGKNKDLIEYCLKNYYTKEVYNIFKEYEEFVDKGKLTRYFYNTYKKHIRLYNRDYYSI